MMPEQGDIVLISPSDAIGPFLYEKKRSYASCLSIQNHVTVLPSKMPIARQSRVTLTDQMFSSELMHSKCREG